MIRRTLFLMGGLLLSPLLSSCSWFNPPPSNTQNVNTTQPTPGQPTPTPLSDHLLRGVTSPKPIHPDFESLPPVNTTPATSTGTLKPGGTFVGVDGVSITAPTTGFFDVEGELVTELQVTIERVDPSSIRLDALSPINPLINVYRVSVNQEVFETGRGFQLIIPTTLKIRITDWNFIKFTPKHRNTDQASPHSAFIFNHMTFWPVHFETGASITFCVSNLYKNGEIFAVEKGENAFFSSPNDIITP